MKFKGDMNLNLTRPDIIYILKGVTGINNLYNVTSTVEPVLSDTPKGPGKCVGLYRMLEYSGFMLVNSNTLGP
jgi:hypothetical protein